MAAKWKEPPRDALDTLTLNAVDMASMDLVRHNPLPLCFSSILSSILSSSILYFSLLLYHYSLLLFFTPLLSYFLSSFNTFFSSPLLSSPLTLFSLLLFSCNVLFSILFCLVSLGQLSFLLFFKTHSLPSLSSSPSNLS